MLKKFTPAERGWIMYDWANSAFAAIIAAIILPNFYTNLTEGNVLAGSWWGYATSIATFICAICAPIFGTLGDYPGWKKRLFTGFALLGIAATAALGFTANWQVILVFYIIGTIGFNGSCVFYDGFLPDVTTNDRMDMVSTYGYALGYIGGSTIPLLISMVFVLKPELFGISATLGCQISFLITAVWWLVFTVPMWKHVQQRHSIPVQGNVVAQTFQRLGTVGKQILKNGPMLRFILAYFFYIDGVGTIIHMATIFGRNMGLESAHMIVILMVVQLVAFPCAILYGVISKKIGVRNTIIIGIVTYLLVCMVALGLEPLSKIGETEAPAVAATEQLGDAAEDTADESALANTGADDVTEATAKKFNKWPLLIGFIVLAMLVGTAQGGIQALSRSFYGKLVPPESANEYFGFFDIFGKFSAVIGPALFSLVWEATQKVYLGIVPLLCMFLAGLLLFLTVPNNVEKTH